MKRAPDLPSQCEEMRRHLDEYLDDEITDASLLHAVEKHLEGCLDCRSELDVLEALHDRLQGLPALTASKTLRGRIHAGVRELAEARHKCSSARLSPRSMMIVGMTAASLLIFSVSRIWLWSTQDDWEERHLAEQRDLIAFVDDYVAYVQSDSAPSVETSAPDIMESWLSARLEFSPDLPRWSWAELISGRLCFIHNRRVARVQYRAGEIDLSLFVQPLAESESLGDNEAHTRSSVTVETLRGFTVACWQDSGLDYVLVGPTSSAQFFTNLEMEMEKE